MDPWAVQEFREWLKKERNETIIPKVTSSVCIEIVDLVFQILDTRLQHEFVKADKEFSTHAQG